nr:MAG TPA: hypothetical protein [Caudoviricetes sp.]
MPLSRTPTNHPSLSKIKTCQIFQTPFTNHLPFLLYQRFITLIRFNSFQLITL